MGSDSFSPCCNTTILSTCEQLAACRAVFSGDYSLETNAGEYLFDTLCLVISPRILVGKDNTHWRVPRMHCTAAEMVSI